MEAVGESPRRRRKPAATRVTMTVALDRKGMEMLELEIRRSARLLGLAVAAVRIRTVGPTRLP
jgi:hypothetical protein